MSFPGPDRPLPQNHAIECIPRHEEPLGRQCDRCGLGLVNNVEYAPAGRDDGADTGEMVVTSGPFRPANPLDVIWRPYNRIIRNGIVARIVEEVCPLVELFGPRLDSPGPCPAFFDIRYAVGTQHAHHLAHRNSTEVLRHYEINKIVGVRQPVACKQLYRYLAIETQGANMVAGFFNVVGIGVQAVNQVAVIGVQCGGQPAIGAADVDHEPAGNACGVQDLPSLPANLCRPLSSCRQRDRDNHQKTGKYCRESAFFLHEHFTFLLEYTLKVSTLLSS
ncbi:hypothetical protein ES703_111317 [subsurface metagenome]